ncbi:putative BOI-related E3 ubiquitin-protein ligase 3 [Raphanus sativus]|uniref:Probable BOI-related E3 ubiquitin-protein ligase 3 n=1 Tax=Raphanus sativus TaxID=3726 RepID=A0A6J0P3C8_RAPSA|nr:probable BOI-related E3 ubiquitin-protein ligase 3 [Raphanus sativus]KAJ4872816.1 putative BOI-related E3 ubiquitin-protein ligase 3 [Raphanus sativus]
MAVEAHHRNPVCSPNVAGDFLYREMMHPLEANGFVYNGQFRHGNVPAVTMPFNPTVESQTSLLNSTYNISPVDYLVHQSIKPTIHSVDSSVTFNSERNGNNVDFLRPSSSSSLRKRPREESLVMPSQKRCTDPLMFLGQDLSPKIDQHHSLDIDRLISNHVEIIRMEIDEKRNTQGRKIMEAIEQGLMEKLRNKDEEINHIQKLNLYLEEKVKSLCAENQIWRDVAQSNEATVNALRSNLQQVLADVERREEPTAADDTQSCCGSNDEGDSDETWRLVGEEAQVRTVTRTMCRGCGEGEASVLLLPCRHMCLCLVCGSSLNTCPVCKSPKNASIHINLSL